MGDSKTTIVGVSKVDQVASNWHNLDVIEALFSSHGPSITLDIPWLH